ncbi:glycoside hydrolase superfamily [Entophlyctis helioformis]|nr:glycoside hydrolase superfamily [Entophlyctis helioformis]
MSASMLCAVGSTVVVAVIVALLSVVLYRLANPSVYKAVSTLYDSRIFSPPSPETAVVARIIGVDSESNHLVDEHGRIRLFHGVNVVYKASPWHPATDKFDPVASFADEDAALLSELGINSIRLAVHWAGVEPEPGQYNSTYMDKIRQIVRSCATHGIYVLLEFHQDVLAQQFCGHGVPKWMFNATRSQQSWRKFPVPQTWRPFEVEDADGIPTVAQCDGLSWPVMYFTMAVADAFGKFYSNHDGMMDRFAAYWQHVATEFRDEPNLLGYEIMNEPWPGNHWRNPFLLLPGIASQTTLYEMDGRIAAAIRSVHPSAIVYFEGATWDLYNRAPSVPGGPDYANKTVLSYHYYRPPAIGTPEDTFRRRKVDARRLGCGLFMTEFEMWWGSGSPASISQIWGTVRAADAFQQSWMGWSYKSFAQQRNSIDSSLFDDTTGKRRPEMERLLSRPYATAVQGLIERMEFNDTERTFTLVWTPRNVTSGVADRVPDAEVALARRVWYPDGFRVSLEPRGRASWTYDALRQQLSVRLQPSVVRANLTIAAARAVESLPSPSSSASPSPPLMPPAAEVPQ